MKTIDSTYAARLVPWIDSDANKYTRGTCELVVDDRFFAGAGVLAVMAATRMGAGYVKAYTSPEAAQALRIVQPSAVCAEFKSYGLECHAQDESHPSATVVGCGLVGSEGNICLVKSVIAAAAVPLLIDGGAITAIATEEGFAALSEHCAAGFSAILTPHGGEASRLAAALSEHSDEGIRAREASESGDSASLALWLARAYSAVCVLKGPVTYIASPQDKSVEEVLMFNAGTPALAKAGTGDVLAGCIGALLSQGLDPVDAAALGVYVHGHAGVLAAQEAGEFSTTTEDVLRHLPASVRSLG